MKENFRQPSQQLANNGLQVVLLSQVEISRKDVQTI